MIILMVQKTSLMLSKTEFQSLCVVTSKTNLETYSKQNGNFYGFKQQKQPSICCFFCTDG